MKKSTFLDRQHPIFDSVRIGFFEKGVLYQNIPEQRLLHVHNLHIKASSTRTTHMPNMANKLVPVSLQQKKEKKEQDGGQGAVYW